MVAFRVLPPPPTNPFGSRPSIARRAPNSTEIMMRFKIIKIYWHSQDFSTGGVKARERSNRAREGVGGVFPPATVDFRKFGYKNGIFLHIKNVIRGDYMKCIATPTPTPLIEVLLFQSVGGMGACVP